MSLRSAELTPPWNYVFVDFENVTSIDFAALGTKPAKYILLLGANQARLEIGLVGELMKHAGAVELIRLTSSGKNALDFALAYYVGRAAVLDPSGIFHFVSKDQGFDPLIEHLKSRRIRAYRHHEFSALTFARPPLAASVISRNSSVPLIASAGAKSGKAAAGVAKSPAVLTLAAPAPEAALQRALQHLKEHSNNRPMREKALLNFLHNLIGKTATPEDAQKLCCRMKDEGYLQISENGGLTYHLTQALKKGPEEYQLTMNAALFSDLPQVAVAAEVEGIF